MKKSRKDKHFIKQAYYKGGSKALEAFILENLQYPQDAFDNSIEGTIHAKYDINMRGKITKIKLYNSIGYGCDEEAKRVIRLLHFEVPKTRGLRLTFHKEIHIHFRMPRTNTLIKENVEIKEKVEEPIEKPMQAEQSTTAPLNIEYKVVKSTVSENTETPKKEIDKGSSNHYNYTVKY